MLSLVAATIHHHVMAQTCSGLTYNKWERVKCVTTRLTHSQNLLCHSKNREKIPQILRLKYENVLKTTQGLLFKQKFTVSIWWKKNFTEEIPGNIMYFKNAHRLQFYINIVFYGKFVHICEKSRGESCFNQK